MIGTTLEIESYFGDCVLSGPELSYEKLEAQLAQAQRESGGNRNGFLSALERLGWRIAESGLRPQCRYDLDIEAFYAVKY